MRFPKLLIVFMMLQITSFASNFQDLFMVADKNKSAAEELLASSEKCKNQSNLNMAYYAVAKMLMANHVLNPYKKLSYFNEGKSLLEKCIQSEHENLEIIFLRYSVQVHAPSFLGYSSKIKDDKAFLKNNLSKINNQNLRQAIISVLSKQE